MHLEIVWFVIGYDGRCVIGIWKPIVWEETFVLGSYGQPFYLFVLEDFQVALRIGIRGWAFSVFFLSFVLHVTNCFCSEQ